MEQSWSLGRVVILAKAALALLRASDERAEERVDLRFSRSLSSFMDSYLLAEMMARKVVAVKATSK